MPKSSDRLLMVAAGVRRLGSGVATAAMKRGIKLNIPLDKESATYGNPKADSSNHAILNVWDLPFWTTWLDVMARNRYNVLSLWSNHAFSR